MKTTTKITHSKIGRKNFYWVIVVSDENGKPLFVSVKQDKEKSMAALAHYEAVQARCEAFTQKLNAITEVK